MTSAVTGNTQSTLFNTQCHKGQVVYRCITVHEKRYSLLKWWKKYILIEWQMGGWVLIFKLRKHDLGEQDLKEDSIHERNVLQL